MPFIDPNFVVYLGTVHRVPLINGIIDPTDAATLEKLKTITNLQIPSKPIKSLKGIEYMTALTFLNCSENTLSTLGVSTNTALKRLSCTPMMDADGNNLLATLTYSFKPEGASWTIPTETTQTQVPPPAVK